jgi:hypothetical protein
MNKNRLRYIDPVRFAAEQKADSRSKWIAVAILIIILGLLALFATTTAMAGEYPSMNDGHWYHTNRNGAQVNMVPNFSTIRDGHWYHEGSHYGNEGEYTRDRFGNFIEF